MITPSTNKTTNIKLNFLNSNFKRLAGSARGKKFLIAIACIFLISFILLLNNKVQEWQKEKLRVINKDNLKILNLQKKVNDLESQLINSKDKQLNSDNFDGEFNSISYFSKLRLKNLSDDIVKESYVDPVYVTITAEGELKTSVNKNERQIPRSPFFLSKSHNIFLRAKSDILIGVLENYKPQIELIKPMIFEGKLYAVSGAYLVRISENNAVYISVPKINNPEKTLNPTSFLLPSPDNKWLAISLTSSNPGNSYYSTILLTDKEFLNFKITYWEDSKFKPTQKSYKGRGELFSPSLNLLGWAADSTFLYVTWELSSLGPPPLSGCAKIDLNGKFTDTNLSDLLTPIAISPNEKYIFAVSSFFKLKDAVIYSIDKQETVKLPYNEIIIKDDTSSQKNTNEKISVSDQIGADAYFSSDNENLFFTISPNIFNANAVKRSYKFNLSSKNIKEIN